jgi:hypothetical protein
VASGWGWIEQEFWQTLDLPPSRSRGQEVQKAGDARRQFRVAVVHRIDPLAYVRRVVHENLHQCAALAVGGGHEIRKAHQARTLQPPAA